MLKTEQKQADGGDVVLRWALVLNQNKVCRALTHKATLLKTEQKQTDGGGVVFRRALVLNENKVCRALTNKATFNRWKSLFFFTNCHNISCNR